MINLNVLNLKFLKNTAENVGRDWGRATNTGRGFVEILEYFSYREGEWKRSIIHIIFEPILCQISSFLWKNI